MGEPFGFVGPSYRSQSVAADCQVCLNWYLEAIESGTGVSRFVNYRTAGLSLALYNLGAGPVRGIETFLGRTFAVAGSQFYELLAPNASPNKTNWSLLSSINLPTDGSPVSIAYGGHQLLVASVGQAFVFDLSTNTFTQVDPSGGANLPIAQVAYSDGFFLALVENQAPVPWQINSSKSLDATTWPGTNFTEVSVFPDNPNGIFRAARILWVFGPRGIQPYVNTGDFPFPFDVFSGTFIENGLAAPFSMARMDNSIFWLGADERGTGMVWRANGFTPQRVSNHAIEFALQSYATISDAIGVAVQDQGHSFYELHFPTADKTWRYDAATGMWHERAFWNQKNATFGRSRACFHTFNYGMHLRGDPTTGAVYQESINFYSDFGNAIRRIRRAPHRVKGQEYEFHEQLQVYVESGLQTFDGNLPTTVLTLSDPSGALWSVRVTDVGVLDAHPGSQGAALPFYITDLPTNTSWQLAIDTIGGLTIVPVAFNAFLDSALTMVSDSGKSVWSLQLRQIAPSIGQAFLNPLGLVQRGPLWTLRWSNDGAHTFSNGQSRQSGALGETRTRLLWNRLGRARDRVYELEFSEAAPAAIIDAYLTSKHG
jgi:hypothetical protein